MKKIIAITLLLCITVPIIGTYGWLSFQQYQTKKAVKRKLKDSLNKDQLVRLAFTPKQADAELYWEHSKEFEYRGEMYDVVEQETIGDSTIYWCWWDNEETEFNRQLAELVEDALDTNPDHSKQKKKLFNFLKALYHSQEQNTTLYSFLEATLHSNIYFVNYHNIRNNPPTPPPQIAIVT